MVEFVYFRGETKTDSKSFFTKGFQLLQAKIGREIKILTKMNYYQPVHFCALICHFLYLSGPFVNKIIPSQKIIKNPPKPPFAQFFSTNLQWRFVGWITDFKNWLENKERNDDKNLVSIAIMPSFGINVIIPYI